jgi:monofunctional biosynthetic peptidoglycan transglycosylase
MHPLVKGIFRYTFLTFKYILITIKWLFIAYAVAFAIAGTIVLYKGYQFVMTPIREVKALQNNNPRQTLFMARYRETLLAHDSLVQVFIPLDSISEHLKRAVIAAEDDGFYTHPGFDIAAILEAMEYNRINNSIKRGASTLTQQLAKNLFLTPERSFERKYKELMYTVLMEKFLGKKRIFELYLNYAQWGKTIFGCEAAARYYYKKSCTRLSRMEAVRLAAVLAKPEKVSPLNANSTFIPKRIAVIANNLYIHHLIDDSGYTALTGYPPPDKDSGDSEAGAPLPVQQLPAIKEQPSIKTPAALKQPPAAAAQPSIKTPPPSRTPPKTDSGKPPRKGPFKWFKK